MERCVFCLVSRVYVTDVDVEVDMEEARHSFSALGSSDPRPLSIMSPAGSNERHSTSASGWARAVVARGPPESAPVKFILILL